MRGRRGAILPLVLVVLLLTGGMAVLSLALVETISETVRFSMDDELLLSAAVSGVERGKMLLEEKFLSAGILPHRREPALTLSAEDLTPPFSALIVEGCEDRFFINPPGTEVIVTVYDLCYETAPDVRFLQGVPPRFSSGRASGLAVLADESLQRQGYASSNISGSSQASFSDLERTSGAYLVRAVATLGFLSKTAELALLLWY